MHKPTRSVLSGTTLLCALALASCGPADELGDGPDDSFLADGKADSLGLDEGTAETCGVLRVGNELSVEALDDEVGLSSTAARAIGAYRAGPDGAAGTGDDGYLDSLAELDAVKYVGPRTLERMADHAVAHGLACTTVDLQLLSLSDWHAQIDPVSIPAVGNVGGAAALATYFGADRVANPRTLTLSAGDAFGASPPLASYFGEQPAIEALDLMRLDYEVLGNHDFDRGLDHLREMAALADFRFLSANLANADAALACPGEPGARCALPYEVRLVGGVKVAIVGLSTPETPDVVKPGALGPIAITDPVAAATAARAAAAAEGARVFVLVAHLGASGTPPTGPLMDLAAAVQGYDLILGGHTHNAIATTVGDVPVVQGKTTGQVYGRARLRWDFGAGAVTERAAELVTPIADGVTPDPAILDLLAPWRALMAEAFDGAIAIAEGLFERGNNVERLREVPIGNLLADAVRLGTGAQIGFVNGGGIRAPIPSSYAPAATGLRRPAGGPAPWDVVIGDAYAVLPFGNAATVCTVTGAQLWQMLEHSVEALPNPAGSFAQISGLRFTFDSARPARARVVSVELADGTPIAADATTYTVATSDFLALGGDGYGVLAGAPAETREALAELLIEHIRGLGALAPVTDGRIRDLATP